MGMPAWHLPAKINASRHDCGVTSLYKLHHRLWHTSSFFLTIITSLVDYSALDIIKMESRNILTTGAPYHIIASVYLGVYKLIFH